MLDMTLAQESCKDMADVLQAILKATATVKQTCALFRAIQRSSSPENVGTRECVGPLQPVLAVCPPEVPPPVLDDHAAAYAAFLCRRGFRL